MTQKAATKTNKSCHYKKTVKINITDTSPTLMPAMALFAEAGFLVSGPWDAPVETSSRSGSWPWSGPGDSGDDAGCWGGGSCGSRLVAARSVMTGRRFSLCWPEPEASRCWTVSLGSVRFFWLGRAIWLWSESRSTVIVLALGDCMEVPSGRVSCLWYGTAGRGLAS